MARDERVRSGYYSSELDRGLLDGGVFGKEMVGEFYGAVDGRGLDYPIQRFGIHWAICYTRKKGLRMEVDAAMPLRGYE